MSKSYDGDKVNKEELSHVLDNFNDHFNEVAGVLDNSEEIEESKPHSEGCDGKHDSYPVIWLIIFCIN